MDQKSEIRSYINCRIRLNIDAKQIFNELCGINGPQTISMRTVFRWVKAFKAGKFLLKMIPVLEGLKPLLPRPTSLLKKRLDLRKVCARWVPHLLTEVQKTQRLKCARELLKTYKGCNSRVISTLLTGDETWVHMFEPQRRVDNKQWKRKNKKRPCIAKRTISSKKMLYAIFFNSCGPVVQVPCHWPILQEFCTKESERVLQ